MDDQEEYLNKTETKQIIRRGIHKLITEMTSIKTLFLAFLCVAMAYGWIGDMAGIIGGLATLGVKEVPTEVFTAMVKRIVPGRSNGNT